MTNQFSKLFLQSADEVREYQRTSPNAYLFGDEWLEYLAKRLESASTLIDNVSIEREVDTIAYSIIDSGPVTENFLPSFQEVLSAVQERRKRRNTRHE